MEPVAAASPGQATIEPHNLALNESELVGCYELVSLVWTPAFDGRAAYQPPRLFEFTSKPFGDRGTRLIRFRKTDHYILGGWMLTSPTELTVTWSMKYQGVGFVVSRRSADRRFHGRVDTYTDIAGQDSKNRGQVVFRQARCPRSAE
jgi:hypothetical protein